MFRRLSLGGKLTVLIALLVAATAAAIVFLQRGTILETASNEAVAKVEEISYRNSNLVAKTLTVPLDAARSLAQLLETAKADATMELTREKVITVLKGITTRNSQFIGTWTCWEPNAFDKKDAEFIDKPGHDKTGRFIPYLCRNEKNEVVLEPLKDYEKEGDGNYYLLCKKTEKETLLDPYKYTVAGKTLLMTSLVVPIKVDGKFLGVAGIDIALDNLQKIVTDFKGGVSAIFSNNGTVVAKFDGTSIGEQMRKTEADMTKEHLAKFADSVQAGEEHHFFVYADKMKTDVYIQVVPIWVGQVATPWGFAVGIPMTQVLAAPKQMLQVSMMIGGVACVVAVFVALMIARSISKPILVIAEGARHFSVGNIELKGMDLSMVPIINARGDELGVTGRAFSELIEYMKKKVSATEAIASGNLGITIEMASPDDTLGKALEKMVASLKTLITDVQVISDQIVTSSEQFSQASQTLSQGATSQASSIEEITSSMTEIGAQIKTNAENATEANALAGTAKNAGNKGCEQMEYMMSAMGEITQSSQQVAKIIKVIDDIAFQTNLLSLNAAVEAARAGKHGKGFAVVAEEVRNLASRSAKAARETGEMMESAAKKVANGSEMAMQSAVSLQEIVSASVKVADLLQEVVVASNEQSQGVSQISQGLSMIEQVTQQNTASSEETASASIELSQRSIRLRELLSHFRVSATSGNSTHQGSGAAPEQKAHLQRLPSKQTTQRPQDIIALSDNEFGKY